MIYLVVGKLKLDCPPLFDWFSRFEEKKQSSARLDKARKKRYNAEKEKKRR